MAEETKKINTPVVNKQQNNNKKRRQGETKKEHLKRIGFQPGQSGNPEGRPEGVSLTSAIKKKLKELPTKGEKRTYLDMIVDKLMEKATTEGSEQILKTIWAYLDGKPSESLKISGKITIPLTSIIITPVKNDKPKEDNTDNGGD